MKGLLIFGIFILVYMVYMFVIALIPTIPVKAQPLNLKKKPKTKKGALRREVFFDVKGTQIHAWLYLPSRKSKTLPPLPCIIMAHGLGAVKEMGLGEYAKRFQTAGYAVLVFDYRFLGYSEGEPRGLVWIPNQLEDYKGAIEFARNLPEIDENKIALWGTSLSGGHVVVAASRDPKIVCISAQVPLLAGDAGGMEIVKKTGLKLGLRLAFVHGIRDIVRSWLKLSPHKIPIVGKPGTVAMMPHIDAWNAFENLAPSDYINEGCARIMIRMDKYHPINHAKKIQCPVLLQICEKDLATTPPKVIEKAKKILGDLVTTIHYPLDHFEIYTGNGFDQSVTDQIKFFQKNLK